MKLHTKTIVLILLLIISLIFLLSYFFYTKYKFLIDYIDSRTDLKLEKFSSRYNLENLEELNKIKEQDYIKELKNNIINNNSENFFSKINNLSDIEEEEEDLISNTSSDDKLDYPINEELDKSENPSPISNIDEEISQEKTPELTPEQEIEEKEEFENKEETPELSFQIADDELPNLDNLDENIDNYIENILNENKDNDIDTSLIEVEKKN